MIINCKGQLLDLSSPQIMGVLNATPDSFYAGSRWNALEAVVQQGGAMLQAGARILDVGGVSSRPGAAEVLEEAELQRVIPVIEALHQAYPNALLSVDTYRARVAEEAIAAGASLINDISAANLDEHLLEVVAAAKVPYILMHMKGTPATMQANPQYEDVLLEVLDFFIQKLAKLKALGIEDVILDVGFGFGKTLEHNYTLLQQLHWFHQLNRPLLVGVSRKSMIWKVLENSPQEALNGTTVLHTAAIKQGAHLLRVHDVKEAVETVRLCEWLKKCQLTTETAIPASKLVGSLL